MDRSSRGASGAPGPNDDPPTGLDTSSLDASGTDTSGTDTSSLDTSGVDASTLASSLASSSLPVPTPGRLADALVEAAEIVLQRRFRVVLLIRNAYERMTGNADTLEAVWADLRTLLRLLLAWTARSYERIPWPPLVLMAGAAVYFVVPTDLLPDALPAIGFVDDVVVIRTVVESVRDELERFRAWEQPDASLVA
jgi:uncharacterized membrane protein YkvA (DUF1232 family)